MFSQHKNLAAAWVQLQRGRDISATLREVIGQQALQHTFEEDETQTSNKNYQRIIWIKTIYDIQRCYLSGTTTGTSELPREILSCLLPPELLFSSILYLIRANASKFSSQTTLVTDESARPRLVLAQTLVSGLRLLLLHKYQLSRERIRHLQMALSEAWKDDDVGGAERCIIQQIFPSIIDTLSKPDHVDAYGVERDNARLPTFASGLYPLDIRPETSVTPLIIAMAEEDDDWIDAYFVLYDALWAVECAITKRYIDLGRQHGTIALDPSTVEHDEIFEQLYHQRSSLIVSVFHFKGAVLPSSTIMESLAIALLDWDPSLDNFLSRQDSLLQHRMSLPEAPIRYPNYGKLIAEMRPFFDIAITSFASFLSSQETTDVFTTFTSTRLTPVPMQSNTRDWVHRIASADASIHSQNLEGPDVPVYVVDCPKLHVVPKKYLAYQLRWSDKWAYEGLEEQSPLVNWKEGVQCPSCTTREKIKCARLLEPLCVPSAVVKNEQYDIYSQSQCSGESSGSYMLTSASTMSRSISDGSMDTSFPGQSTMNISVPTTVSQPRSDPGKSRSTEPQLPQYTESPVSPITQGFVPQRARSHGSSLPQNPISPLAASLDVPIAMETSSRLSMNLPIPVYTHPISDSVLGGTPLSAPSDMVCDRLTSPSTTLTWSAETYTKSKPASRSARIANSMRRKPTTKEKSTVALPTEPVVSFSSTGRSLLLWGKNRAHVVRFDIPTTDSSAMQGCRYDIEGVEALAAGESKCAILAAKTTSKKTLMVFDGLDLTSRSEVELEVSGRSYEICIAISKDDRHVAVSMNDQVDLFSLENGLKRVAFHHQMNVYELRGGVSNQRSIPVTRTTSDDSIPEAEKLNSGSWFGVNSKALNFKEAAEEQSRQTAIISRKLYFSTDSQRLVVATQLGDHCVYIDIWDVTREPVSTISEHSRSFKLPPWVLNDGDLTGVFYDSTHRAALVTAFLSKEYPVLIPFPGYDALQNETYSTKIVSAAQSPSGSTFIIANAMTEIIQFEYTAKGTLSPRKLKKASNKISNSVFKPGAIALAMPSEHCLQAFWIKDGKCILRSIKLGGTETIKDVDIRPHYDRLMGLERPVITRAPSVNLPELDAGDFI